MFLVVTQNFHFLIILQWKNTHVFFLLSEAECRIEGAKSSDKRVELHNGSNDEILPRKTAETNDQERANSFQFPA